MGVSPTRNDSSQQRPKANQILLWVVTLLYLFEWKKICEFTVEEDKGLEDRLQGREGEVERVSSLW